MILLRGFTIFALFIGGVAAIGAPAAYTATLIMTDALVTWNPFHCAYAAAWSFISGVLLSAALAALGWGVLVFTLF